MKDCRVEDCEPKSCDTCRETAKAQYKELVKKAREEGLSNKLCDTIASHRKMMNHIGFEVEEVQAISQASQEDTMQGCICGIKCHCKEDCLNCPHPNFEEDECEFCPCGGAKVS